MCNAEHEGAADVTVNSIAGFAQAGVTEQSIARRHPAGTEIPGALNLPGFFAHQFRGFLGIGPAITNQDAGCAMGLCGLSAASICRRRAGDSLDSDSGQSLKRFGWFWNPELLRKAFYARTTLGPTMKFRDITLKVEHPEDSRKLIIENDTPGGGPADLLVSGVSLIAPRDSHMWKRLASKP